MTAEGHGDRGGAPGREPLRALYHTFIANHIYNTRIMRFYLPMTFRLPVLAAAAALVLSGCSTTTTGLARPAAPPPLATEESLTTMLLPAEEVGAALGSEQLAVSREVGAPWDDSAYFGGDETGCLPIAGAAQQAVYDGSGWTALRGQVLREPPTAPGWSHFAVQAVVLFPTAAAATDFYTRSASGWAGCANREMTYDQQLAPDQLWTVGPVSTEADVLAVSRSQRSPQQWFCQRALSVRSNVAVDVEACSADGPTTAAAAMARAIGDRLPTP